MDDFKYESALGRLQEITEKLDSGSLELAESLGLYEEATKLTALCSSYLENAKLKITELSQKKEDE